MNATAECCPRVACSMSIFRLTDEDRDVSPTLLNHWKLWTFDFSQELDRNGTPNK